MRKKIIPKHCTMPVYHCTDGIDTVEGFYMLYILEFLLALLYFCNWHKAYRNISFEVEAYTYQDDLNYLQHRKRFAWSKFDW